MEQLNIYDELLEDQEFTTRLRVILVREATAP
jgi:hypothetical protein